MKAQMFRDMINSNDLEFILEAHNGLSAKVVERSGFKGIFASGLSISTALGVRDSNEASWTQVLEVVEFMSDATTLPIMIDADTGYGDFNNVRRLVKKLEQIDVAAMCIEDKIFPKKNSLLQDAKQPLAEITEFTGKIRAAKDTQKNSSFSVVARTEAFIAGRGLNEAIDRANAYAEAGADAILVHSKKNNADEVLSFMEKWEKSVPIVIVPTTYSDTPIETFQKAGVSLVVWANHMMRTSLQAMEDTAAQIYRDKSPVAIENNIAKVKHVFEIFDYDELKKAELKYLPEE